MLGEDHSLLHDFPEHQARILDLLQRDSDFAAENRRYNKLDQEIRKLELRGSPIDDEAMHQLKHDRAELKDKLYQRLSTQ